MGQKSRDTFKYHFKRGNKILHGGITNDLERREGEHNRPSTARGTSFRSDGAPRKKPPESGRRKRVSRRTEPLGLWRSFIGIGAGSNDSDDFCKGAGHRFPCLSPSVPKIGVGPDDSDDLCKWPVSHKQPRIGRIV